MKARAKTPQSADSAMPWPQRLFESLFLSSPSAMGLLDRDLRFVAVNDAYCQLFDRTPEDFVGHLLLERFPDRPGTGAPDKVRRSLETVFRTGEVDVLSFMRYDIEAPGRPNRFDERYWSVTNFPVSSRSGTIEFAVIHPVEVTTFVAERFRAVAMGQPHRSAELTRALDAVFGAEIERLKGITTFAEALVDTTTLEQVARIVVRDGLKAVEADAGSFAVLDGERFRIMAHTDVGESTVDEWTEFTVSAGNEPFSDAVLAGKPLLFESRTAFLEAYPHLRDAVETESHHAWAVLPLMEGGNAVGAIGVIFDDNHSFTAVTKLELLALRDLAWQAASRAKLADEQAAALISVQNLLDIQIEELPGLEVSTLYRPASQMLTAGGDFFDVIAADDGRVVFIIADVADHGAHTAGEMVRARATLQNNVVSTANPKNVATTTATTLERFAARHTTACIASYDARNGVLTWTVAGHPHPLVRKSNGDVIVLTEVHGPPLGVPHPSADYSESSCALEPGDTLVLYTDGLIEQRGEPITDSIERLVAELRSVGPGDLADTLYRRLLPTGVHDDDVAILTVTVTGVEPKVNDIETLELEPVLANVSEARRFVESHLSDAPDSDPMFVIAVAEIVTNAIEAHVRNDVGKPVLVTVDPSTATVTVSDSGGGFEAEHATRPLPPNVARGRGLLIATSICPELVITQTDQGVDVTLPFG